MTAVIIYLKNGEPCGFEVSGHAGFSEAGGDIVCASVSSAVMLVSNGITEIVGAACDMQVKESLIKLMLPQKLDDEKKKQAILFLEAFRLHVFQLEEQYGDYLKSDVMEV